MAKQVRQFRYYSKDDSNKNYPSSIAYRNLVSGSIFSDYMPIIQLGIQGLPGTKFYLNNSNNPIIIGYTGVYELNLDGVAEIKSLQFDANSINMIEKNPNAYLIVDIIYEKDGE